LRSARRAALVAFLALSACPGTAALVVPPPALAAPGDLDPSFSQDGKQVASFGLGSNIVTDATVDDAGRVVVAGSHAPISGSQDVALLRLRADGTPDPTFGDDGVLRMDFTENETATGVEPAPDGGIYVSVLSGVYASSASTPTGSQITVLRLRDDGSLDPHFSEDGIASSSVDGADAGASDLDLTPAGSPIVTGTAIVEGHRELAVAQFRPDGTPDPGLGGDGDLRVAVPRFVSARRIETDGAGRILIGGETEHEPLIARFHPGGELDLSFSQDGVVTHPLAAAEGVTELAVGTGGEPIVAAGLGTRVGSFDRYWTSFVLGLSETGEVVSRAEAGDGPAVGGLVASGEGFTLAFTRDFCAYRGGCGWKDFTLDRYLPSGIDPNFGSGQSPSVETDFSAGDEWVEALATGRGGSLVAAGVIGGGPTVPRSGAAIAIARYLDAPGPRDPDADGVLAGADICGRSYAPSDSLGCAQLPIQLTLERGRRHGREGNVTFTGFVRSTFLECAEFREGVQLVRLRPGRDTVLAIDTTNTNGRFWFKGINGRSGKYVARVRNLPQSRGMCPAKRSPVVELKPPGWASAFGGK
jgi:uncharacterized delta-60 repeat protein